MSQNPLNLAFRFFLELAVLLVMGVWGWRSGDGWMRCLLALGLPLVMATLWGVFRIPNDPGPAPVAVPGLLRLALELAYFGFATWALFDIGAVTAGWVFGLAVAVHYLISYDRVGRMIRQKAGVP